MNFAYFLLGGLSMYIWILMTAPPKEKKKAPKRLACYEAVKFCSESKRKNRPPYITFEGQYEICANVAYVKKLNKL